MSFHWKIPKLAVGQTEDYNISLKISDGIIKDTTATAKLEIISDEITSPIIIKSGIAVSGEKPFTSGYIPICGNSLSRAESIGKL